MNHEDVAMEYYVAEDRRPVDKCLEDVAACDLYVGIFAWRYGYIPPGYDKSITELEYRKAVLAWKNFKMTKMQKLIGNSQLRMSGLSYLGFIQHWKVDMTLDMYGDQICNTLSVDSMPETFSYLDELTRRENYGI